jgi:hypothetical protein
VFFPLIRKLGHRNYLLDSVDALLKLVCMSRQHFGPIVLSRSYFYLTENRLLMESVDICGGFRRY